MEEWQGPEEGRIREWNKPYLKWLNDVLLDASHWPVAALILMLPLLGILIGILALLGQQPDSVIRAWTETGDWRLSQQIPPPNVMFDEHYLCTVAAQGHPEVVKPLRTGVRNGHRVVVNRSYALPMRLNRYWKSGLHGCMAQSAASMIGTDFRWPV